MPKTRPGDPPVESPEPPQPLPPGTEGSDDVVGVKPHKTCSDGGPKGAPRITPRPKPEH